MTFGEIVRENRKKRGLSQKQLGLLCGYKESSAERTVQFWEYDQQEPPMKALRPLAEALQISLDDLIP